MDQSSISTKNNPMIWTRVMALPKAWLLLTSWYQHLKFQRLNSPKKNSCRNMNRSNRKWSNYRMPSASKKSLQLRPNMRPIAVIRKQRRRWRGMRSLRIRWRWKRQWTRRWPWIFIGCIWSGKISRAGSPTTCGIGKSSSRKIWIHRCCHIPCNTSFRLMVKTLICWRMCEFRKTCFQAHPRSIV